MAVTNPARTVADGFRYRKNLRLDVALEAPAEAVRMRKATFTALEGVASAYRTRTFLRPYLKAMAWR